MKYQAQEYTTDQLKTQLEVKQDVLDMFHEGQALISEGKAFTEQDKIRVEQEITAIRDELDHRESEGEASPPSKMDYIRALEWAGKSPIICLHNWSKKDLNEVLREYKAYSKEDQTAFKDEFIDDVLTRVANKVDDKELECWRSLKYQLESELLNDFSEVESADELPPAEELAQAIIENKGLRLKGKRFELIRVYTSYNKKGRTESLSEHRTEQEGLLAINQTEDKANYYVLLFDKQEGQAHFRGRRQKVGLKLNYHYRDSDEDFGAVKQHKQRWDRGARP